MKTTQFSIPQPCHEDWSKMTPTQKGAFCQQCKKEVIDCTTVKTTEIKQILTAQKEPCVKIFNRQLDELNFIEWFNALNLRNQLKYLFLFTFLLVFNGRAQDLTPTGPPIDTNIPSLDYGLPLPEDTLITQVPENHSNLLAVEYRGMMDVSTGGTAIMTLGGMLIEPITTIEYNSAITDFVITPNQPKDSIPSTTLVINENTYSFTIENQQLVFQSNAKKSERIILKIELKEPHTTIYSDPLRINEGKGEHRFSFGDLSNGVYIISVQVGDQKQALEIIYW